jgi:hypothetical protein
MHTSAAVVLDVGPIDQLVEENVLETCTSFIEDAADGLIAYTPSTVREAPLTAMVPVPLEIGHVVTVL